MMAYLYRHIRPDTNEPFYIGIGKKACRITSKRNRNQFWHKIVNLNNGLYKCEILLDNLSWEEACSKEKEFISLYGRQDIKTGSLCNLTNGGACNNGYSHSESGKLLISKNNARFWLGKKRSLETCLKIGLCHKGSKRTEEAKYKMSVAHKGKKKPYSKTHLLNIKRFHESRKNQFRKTSPIFITNNITKEVLEFPNLVSAGKFLGIKGHSLSSGFHGKSTRFCKGYLIERIIKQ